MPTVAIQGIGNVAFPEGMTPDQIQGAIENELTRTQPLAVPGNETPKQTTPSPPADDSMMSRVLRLVKPAVQTMQQLGEVYPAVEGALSAASGGMIFAPSGIAGLMTSDTFKPVEMHPTTELGKALAESMQPKGVEPADIVRGVQNLFTYKPVTKEGEEFTKTLGYPFELAHQVAQPVGEYAEKWGPEAGAAAQTLAESPLYIAPLLMGLGEERASVKPIEKPQAENVPRETIETPTETPPETTTTAIPIEKPVIDTSKNVPYAAGTDVTGQKVYIDKQIPETMDIGGKTVDVHQFIALHEETEKPLLDKGIPYDEAHKYATGVERVAVENAGIDWKQYSDALEPYISRAEHTRNPDVPHDLETKPYTEEKATGIEAKDKSEVVKATAAMQPGQNYSGFVTPGSKVSVPTSSPIGAQPPIRPVVPITREAILKPFLKAFGVNLYTGNVKGKRTLGFYRGKMGAVRVKKYGDIEVVAHEVAHLLDDRVFGGFGAKLPGQVRRPWEGGTEAANTYTDELKSVSYDKNKTYEGFAEFVRLWMTQPDKAMAAAPHFYQWFNDFVETNKYGPALKEARSGMVSWFNQDSIDRLNSKVGVKDTVEGINVGWTDEFRQASVDDLHGLLHMERDVTGKSYPSSGGPYQTARLTRGATAIVDGAIRYGFPKVAKDGSWTFEGEGLEKIIGKVSHDLNKWKAYAVARSANELMGQGRENLFKPDEIKAGLALETPIFKQVFDEYQKWNSGILTFSQRLGYLGTKQRDSFRRSEYIPFYRINQSITAGRKGRAEGGVNAFHQLRGGTAPLNDIFDNMVRNAALVIKETVKNDARNRAVQFALSDSTTKGGQYITPIAKDIKAMEVAREQLVNNFTKTTYGLTYKKLQDAVTVGTAPPEFLITAELFKSNLDDYTVFFQGGMAPKAENVIAVKYGDDVKFYQIGDPLVWRSMLALSRPPLHQLRKLLNVSRSLMQLYVTNTPDFMAANIIRDTINASVFSKNAFIPVYTSLRGLIHRILTTQTYKDFIANGGGTSSVFLEEGEIQKHLERFYTSHGIDFKTVLNLPHKLIYGLELLGEAFENSTRIGEFEQAIKKGATPREAAYEARDITTDFAMRGDSQMLGWLYDSVPFLKAGVVSLDRSYRAFAKDINKRDVWMKSGALAVASAINAAYLYDNKNYQNLEDWDKDGHWFFYPGGPDGPVLRLPKIWEVGAISSIAERMMHYYLDAIHGQNPSITDLGKHVGNILQQLFYLDYMPGVVAPLYETYGINKNRFTGRPVETQAMQEREPFSRYDVYTHPSMVYLGKMTANLPPELQISPAKAQSLIQGYFSTAGMYGLMIADAVTNAETGKTQPAKDTGQYPVVRRFTEPDVPRSKYDTQFWELAKEMGELHNTITFLTKQREAGLAVEKMKEPENAAQNIVKSGKSVISKIQNAIEVTYQDNTLTPEQKRDKINSLKVELNKAYEVYTQAAQKAQMTMNRGAVQ